MDWGDILRAALSFFLVLLALTGAFMLIRLATLLGRLTVTVDRLSDEVVPLLEKTNATLEQVNAQLVKIDAMTDSALDAVTAADHSVRSVVTTVKAPLAKIAGVTTGIENALGSFRARRRSRRRPPPTPDPAATDAAALADRGGTAP